VYVRLGLGTETPELARFMEPKGILDAGELCSGLGAIAERSAEAAGAE
jgi:hypothetical protein